MVRELLCGAAAAAIVRVELEPDVEERQRICGATLEKLVEAEEDYRKKQFAGPSAGSDRIPGPSLPFHDDFNREALDPPWYQSGGHWALKDGMVVSKGANNAPLFLSADLPDDFVVEFDARSETPFVDTKLELMTNGKDHQSGYVFILGGWNNTISCIARLDEHGRDRVVKHPIGVVGNRTYRWRVEKKGGALRWYLDGKLYMSFDDPAPLHGPGHNRLAFSNWQNEIAYDNLSIWPYDQAPPVRTSTTPAGGR